MHGFGVSFANACSRIKSAQVKKANQALKREAKKAAKKKAEAEKKINYTVLERGLLNTSENIGYLELTESETPIPCPECQTSFFEVKVDGLPLKICQKCRSVWFQRGQYHKFEKSEEAFFVSGVRCRKSKYNCPQCESKMSECVYKIPNNLLIDVCPNKCGVYFEQGELKRAVQITHQVPPKT
jgi:Zn-finger nucleic acid-binding protein